MKITTNKQKLITSNQTASHHYDQYLRLSTLREKGEIWYHDFKGSMTGEAAHRVICVIEQDQGIKDRKGLKDPSTLQGHPQ